MYRKLTPNLALTCIPVRLRLGIIFKRHEAEAVICIRLTCAIKVSCPEGSKTLVLRFEQIIR